MVLCKNIKDHSHTQLLEINKFSRVADTKSIYKNHCFSIILTMNNPKRKFRKQLHLQ